jgi:hypothetical protein
MSFGSNVMPRRFGAGRQIGRSRQLRTTEADLLAPDCPSPGCPRTLYLDTSTRVLRCELHGPMLEASEFRCYECAAVDARTRVGGLLCQDCLHA